MDDEMRNLHPHPEKEIPPHLVGSLRFDAEKVRRIAPAYFSECGLLFCGIEVGG